MNSTPTTRLMDAAPDLLESCKELRVALAASMRVIAAIDARTVHRGLDDSYIERFMAEMHVSGVRDGVGVRAAEAIEKATGETL